MYTVTIFYENGKDEQFRALSFESVRRALENGEGIKRAEVRFPDGAIRKYEKIDIE